jgi:hypothetical protein
VFKYNSKWDRLKIKYDFDYDHINNNNTVGELLEIQREFCKYARIFKKKKSQYDIDNYKTFLHKSMIKMMNDIIVPLNGTYGMVRDLIYKNQCYVKKEEKKFSNKINYEALKELLGEKYYNEIYDSIKP